MIKTTALILAFTLGLASAGAQAEPTCRDAKGKFIKCPPAAASKQVCKDAKGKFAKCGSPGAKPVPAKG